MRKKLLLSGLFMLFCFAQIMAQQIRTVTGTVTSPDGNPLTGASVTVVGLKTGVRTAADGTFSINVPAKSHVLQISYVGSETQKVDVSDLSSVKVVLQSSSQALSDVVIIGYGSARKKDLTGAVSSISAKDFNQGVINSPDQLLQNKIPGLEVTNSTGQPGAATTIQIRGTSSIRANNNPLYVVDGVPLDGGVAIPSLSSAAFGNIQGSDPLLFIDPNSIQQIDIQKDASGAAIYGSRGSNGVVFITTKKGSSGPMKIDVGVSFGDYAGYMKKYAVLDHSQYVSALAKYNIPDSLGYNFGGNVNALKAITQNNIMQNYSVAFSGGNEAGKFRASFLASDNPGFIMNSGLKKYIGTFNGQYKFLDNKLTTEFGLVAGNVVEDQTATANTSGSQGNAISAALSWNPTQSLTNSTPDHFTYPSNGSGNPLAFIAAFTDHTVLTSILGHISAAYKILPNLEYKFLYGVNYESGNRYQNTAGWLQGVPATSGIGIANLGNTILNSSVIDHTLNYSAKLTNKLSLEALAGYEYFKTGYNGGSISATGFNTNLTYAARVGIPYTNILQDAKSQQLYSTFANPSSELQSYFGRLTFNYNDMFVVTGTIRADGSNKFGSNNRYGYFPSGAVKWNISNEGFMKDSHVFSNLGLRASYGVTGNQEFPAGASQEQFGLSSYNVFPQTVNGNPNLKWEQTEQLNVGADFGFAKGKVFGSIDYYKKNTSDILFQTTAIQPAPNSVSYINLPNAHNYNEGVEVGIGVTLIAKQKITWEVSGSFAYNHNIVKNFVDPNSKLSLLIPTATVSGQGVSGTLAEVFTNNEPANEFYLKKFGGFDQSGNQIIAANPTFAGNPNPTEIAGFSTTLRYEKFTLTANMGGSFGYLIYNNTATNITNISGIAQGRNIDLAAYNSVEKPSSAVGASTRFLENGNYWKLRNARILYSFGNAGKYLKNVSAFIAGNNLFVITKFTGFDPEVNQDVQNNGYPSRSISYIPYPTARSFTVGLNFSL
jgi:TonB-dependent starch-binding outer membrane protein SusC